MSNSKSYYTRVMPAQEGLADDVAIGELLALFKAFDSAELLELPKKHGRGGYGLQLSVDADRAEELLVYLHENGYWPCI